MGFRRGFFFRGLIVVLLGFALLGALRNNGGGYERGWLEGYTAGQQAAIASASANDGVPAVQPAPAPPRAYSPLHGWGGGFSPLRVLAGAFFTFVMFALPLMFLMKWLFMGRRHRGWRHHGHGPWQGQGPFGHGGPREKQPEDVEPDIRTV
jgi:hypothetical protein